MRPLKGFIAHVELAGLFEVFVLPVPEGTRFQFYPYPETQKDFQDYLATRFSKLGEPSECTFHPEAGCYEVLFRGLRYASPEEALSALTAGR